MLSPVILVDSNRITAVGPRLSIPPGTQVIDCWAFTLPADSTVDMSMTDGTTDPCADPFDTILDLFQAGARGLFVRQAQVGQAGDEAHAGIVGGGGAAVTGT